MCHKYITKLELERILTCDRACILYYGLLALQNYYVRLKNDQNVSTILSYIDYVYACWKYKSNENSVAQNLRYVSNYHIILSLRNV